MQQALYNPEHGYYAAGRATIGKKGDFFTNVSVGKIYGQILARLFEDLWHKLGKPEEFSIVEQGAHEGELAHDILEALQKKEATSEADITFYKSLRYLIVEPFSLPQQKQQATLKNFSNVTWVADVIDLPRFEGIHFSNELVDAFPIDLLRWDGSSWLEERVMTTPQASYSWTSEPIQHPELLGVAEQLPKSLPVGFLWEVRLGVKPWLTSLAERMKRGVVLIADYGYAGTDRYASYRAEGSIACYQNHQRYENPLEDPGERDITAHVDFTDLAETGIQTGWDLLGYTDQHHFLMGAAEEWLRSLEGTPLEPSTQKALRLFRTLLHPETMGRSFKFLGLGKNIDSMPVLSGFRYNHTSHLEIC